MQDEDQDQIVEQESTSVEIDDDDIVEESSSDSSVEARTNVQDDEELDKYSKKVDKRIKKLTAARRHAADPVCGGRREPGGCPERRVRQGGGRRPRGALRAHDAQRGDGGARRQGGHPALRRRLRGEPRTHAHRHALPLQGRRPRRLRRAPQR